MTDRPAGRRRALLIAVDTYEDPQIPDLRAPRPDARRLHTVLGDPDLGGFSVERVVNPTRYELHLRIAQFYDAAGSQDVLLLYFAGHGFLEDGVLRFAGTDTRRDFMRATALASHEVTELARDSSSRRILIILDCCYSARFFDSLAPRGDDSVHLGEQMPVGDPGVVVLAASESMNYAYEDQSASQYTRLLVDGLRTGEADLDGDGWISADELHTYVSDRMRGLSRTQRPQRLTVGGSAPITVARAASPERPVPPRPATRPQRATVPEPPARPVVGTASPPIGRPAPYSPPERAYVPEDRLSKRWVVGLWIAMVAGVGAATGGVIYLVSRLNGVASSTSHLSVMATVFWILAVIFVVAGILALFRRQILWGVVLIVIGLCVGPGGVSYFT